jgi:hypothetical protein
MLTKYSTAYILKISIYIVISFSLFQNFEFLQRQFSNIDDIGVIGTILSESPMEVSQRQKFINKFFCNQGELATCKPSILYENLYRVSSKWTYAPFQYWFMSPIIEPTLNYEQLKFWGRFPSFVLGVLGIVGLALVSMEVFKSSIYWQYSLVFAVTIFTFSLEQRFYNAHMSSYAAGGLSNCLILFCFIGLLRAEANSTKFNIFIPFLFAIAISMQYQGIVLVVAGLVSLVLVDLTQHTCYFCFKKYIKVFLTTSILTFVICGNIFNLSAKGINWNAGEHNQFIVIGDIFIEKLVSMFFLIFTNFSYNIYSIASPFYLSVTFANIFGLSLFLLFILGYIYNLKYFKYSSFQKLFSYLLPIYSSIYLFLIFSGKFAFSPTRHLLYFLPILSIYSGFGIIFLIKHIPFRIKNIFLMLALAYSVVAVISFSSISNERADVVSEAKIQNFLRPYPLDFTVSGNGEWVNEFVEPLKDLPNLNISIPTPSQVCPINFSGRYFLLISTGAAPTISIANLKIFIDDVLARCGKSPMLSIGEVDSYSKNSSNRDFEFGNSINYSRNNFHMKVYEINYH